MVARYPFSPFDVSAPFSTLQVARLSASGFQPVRSLPLNSDTHCSGGELGSALTSSPSNRAVNALLTELTAATPTRTRAVSGRSATGGAASLHAWPSVLYDACKMPPVQRRRRWRGPSAT